MIWAAGWNLSKSSIAVIKVYDVSSNKHAYISDPPVGEIEKSTLFFSVGPPGGDEICSIFGEENCATQIDCTSCHAEYNRVSPNFPKGNLQLWNSVDPPLYFSSTEVQPIFEGRL